MRCERYRKERDGALDEVDYLRKQLHKARRDENMARLRDKGQCLPEDRVVIWCVLLLRLDVR